MNVDPRKCERMPLRRHDDSKRRVAHERDDRDAEYERELRIGEPRPREPSRKPTRESGPKGPSGAGSPAESVETRARDDAERESARDTRAHAVPCHK